MATVGIPRASGYADYSSGGNAGFVPELWSTKLTTKFYNTTVFGEIANCDYEGEIARMGDVVHIRRTPDITVNPYQVGMTINYQVPDVQATELVIDQGLYWAYQIDNVDRYQSDIDLMDDFTQDAVQKTMEQQDQTLLAGIPGQVAASNQGVNGGAVSGDVNLGTTGAPLSVTSANVIDSVLLAAGQVLDEAKVPRDGKRWIVLPSWLIRKMKNSELKYAYETGDAVSPLRNGRVGRTDDFIIYQSNNITAVTDGSVKGYQCPFGHPAGLTWASQFIDTDAVKLVNQIGTGVYSVCAYGFKVTEPAYLGSVYATPGPGSPKGSTVEHGFAAEASVNNALVATDGARYREGDVLVLAQGTIPFGLHGAQLKVTAVDASGAITGIAVQSQGFYFEGEGPPVSGATVTGGSGAGATFDTTVVGNGFSGFGTYTTDNSAGYYIHWNITGNQRWSVQSGQGDLTVAYSNTAFGLQTAGSWTFQADMQTNDNGGGEFTDLLMYLCGTYGGGSSISGPCVVLSKSDGKLSLYSGISGTNGGAVNGTVVDQKAVSIAGNTLYRLTAECTQQTASSTSGFSVAVTLSLPTAPGTPIATLAGFIPFVGDSLGVGSNHRGDHDHGNVAEFENLLVTVSQPANQATSETTSYVYTYVTQYGTGDNRILQESGPSPPSGTVTFFLDGSTNPVTMTPLSVTILPAPAGQDIVSYNLYRLVQEPDGSEVFEFVQQLAADSASNVVFQDAILDSALSDPLPSAGWAPPPQDLQGILALPNGVMAGFFANTLCLSAQNYPFAWPVANQLPTDTPIVAIAAIDTTVLVLTTGHPYTAWGSDPSAYSMSKEAANQGCVSRRSAATHKRLGVVYASGNGLCYYRGQGQLDLIRMPNGDPYFSVEQWQALNPASIVGVVHDDKYWFWYDNGTMKGGYVMDLSPSGFGLVALDFHVTAAYVDPGSDTLYVVPDFSLYPFGAAAVTAPQNIVYQWRGGAAPRPRSWQRDDCLLPRPACFSLARVRAEDYADVRLKVRCENGTACDLAVGDGRPFVLSPVTGIRWSLALSGSSTVNTVELVEQAGELGA